MTGKRILKIICRESAMIFMFSLRIKKQLALKKVRSCTLSGHMATLSITCTWRWSSSTSFSEVQDSLLPINSNFAKCLFQASWNPRKQPSTTSKWESSQMTEPLSQKASSELRTPLCGSLQSL